jgi:hypothetical protein
MSSICPSEGEYDPGSDGLLSACSIPSIGEEDVRTDSIESAEPVDQTERTHNRAPAPFAWQYGTQLILLDDEPGGWVMAELRFDTELCRYVEVRRAVYEETREAIGAVLSRSLSSGDHAAVDTAISLHNWLYTYYGISIVSDVLTSPDASSIEFTV